MATASTKKADKALLDEARERFKRSQEIDGDNRKQALADTEFVWKKGAQWADRDRKRRENDMRPCLEINMLPQFIKQVVNDGRMNRPGIRVHPANGEASEEVAEILQGLIRHVEYDSNAPATYDVAFEHAVTGGRGYWRVMSEYESPDSFNQKLVIKRVSDPLSVRVDPDYQEPDGADIGWAFVTESMPKETFEQKWPNARALNYEEEDEEWAGDEESVVVADYYRRIAEKRVLVQTRQAGAVWKDELPADTPEDEIVTEREVDDYRVEWVKIAGGSQILERYEWPGKYIPIVLCVGDEIVINGKRIYQGLIRRAIDSQKLFNVSRTSIAEHLAASPKSPWLMAEGQVGPYSSIWRTANKIAHDYLPYVPTTIGGKDVPPPQRVQPAVMPPGLADQALLSSQDLRATIGIYDPSLGQKSNETSGRAIIAREKQGDTATFHFLDNLARAVAHTGRVILDLIPHYYDTQRLVVTIAEDDEQSTVMINQEVPLADAAQAIVSNDVTVGKYSVAIKAGPSYATKRMEAAEFMLQVVQSNPAIMQVAGDLIMKSQDVAGAEELAERLEMMLPPPIQAQIKAKKEKKTPPDPQMMAQLQQMQQQMQQAAMAFQQLQAENQKLKADTSLKAQTAQQEMSIERERTAAEIQLEREKAEAQAELAVQKAELDAKVKMAVAAINRDSEPMEAVGPDVAGIMETLVQGVEGLRAQIERVEQIAARKPRRHIMRDLPTGESVIEELPDDMGEQQQPVQE